MSLEQASVCVVDGSGKVVREGKAASEPEMLRGCFGSLGFALARVALAAGPLSQRLDAAMKKAEPAVDLLEPGLHCAQSGLQKQDAHRRTPSHPP